MQRKTDPDIHIICGKCGCATMFEFELSLDGNSKDNYEYPSVFVTCKNCGTLTGLDEIVKDKTDWKKLKLTKDY